MYEFVIMTYYETHPTLSLVRHALGRLFILFKSLISLTFIITHNARSHLLNYSQLELRFTFQKSFVGLFHTFD